MNFNDVQSRLKRIYSSINARLDSEIGKHINIKNTNGWTMVSFDKENDESINLNNIMVIIDNLAKLKNHLINIIYSNKKPTKGQTNIIEDTINNSLSLQLVMDLSNQDKHGSPLTKTNRSSKNPQIKNVRSSLRLTGHDGQPSKFTMSPITGKINSEGDCKIVINADIMDECGKKIMDVDKLIDGATLEWEKTIEKYHCA